MFSLLYRHPSVMDRYTLYPVTLTEVLAVQLSVTREGTAAAVKSTPDTEALSTLTRAVEGLNV